MSLPVRPARKLGTADATLIVIGGIVGSGIFMTPSIVAQRAQSAPMTVAVWSFGGLVALVGAFIFAELAWRRPDVQGMYGYLRDAFHPVVAFVAGWTALLVSMTGGMAAAGVTFGNYFQPLTHLNVPPAYAAVGAIAVLSAINCLGVREGGTTQNVLTILKMSALLAVIAAGFFVVHPTAHTLVSAAPRPATMAALFGAALVPVLFTYDGWQTAPYLDRELKDPVFSMPRAMLWGVLAVIALYLAVTLAGLHMLGIAGLAASRTPASDMMRAAAGPIGATIVAGGIAISTLGFLSNSILTAPRIYYAMARDGLFFPQFGKLHPVSRVPVFGIAVQGIVAAIITLSGRYDQILAYVTAIDFVFFAAIGVALFVFRRRDVGMPAGVVVPGHPWSTAFFIAVSAGLVVETFLSAPVETSIGLLILLSGVPAYLYWRPRSRRA